jgi:hypothetical protein
MTSAHFPFFSPSNIFFIASKIKELAFLLLYLIVGDILMRRQPSYRFYWQNSLNIALSKYFALSTIMCLGTPYRQIMFCQKNFLIVAELTFVSGFTSIHFVKYSTMITVKV